MWYLKLPPLIYSPSSVRGNHSSEGACVSFLPCLNISSFFPHLSTYMCVYLWLLFSHSVVPDSSIPWTAARQASLSFTISQSLLKLMSIKSVMPSNHLILCHPILLLPSTLPSLRVLSNKSALCIWWPKYWSFSFSIVLLMNIQDWFPLESTGLISL